MATGYLGPPGTFSDEARRVSEDGEGVPYASIHEVVMAVQRGAVARAVVPIENALEGAVSATLDALAGEAQDVAIVGEAVLAIRTCLIARSARELGGIDAVLSHPQPLAQCAGYVRRTLPGAELRAVASTADAVRTVAAEERAWAALGPRGAAERYGCVVLAEDVDDAPGNATRFVWLALAGGAAPAAGPFKTSVIFAGAGDGAAGWLVRCLSEFAFRGVNLTRIESRPLRARLGHYVFHIDLDGHADDGDVRGALAALRSHCEQVRLLGSYPAAKDETV